MDILKKIWALAFSENFVKAILIYLIVGIVVPAVLSILGFIPIVGAILGVVGWVVSTYCFVGFILAILKKLDVLK